MGIPPDGFRLTSSVRPQYVILSTLSAEVCPFSQKNDAFRMKNDAFSLKYDAFGRKNDALRLKYIALRMKNDAFSLKYVAFRRKNDALRMKDVASTSFFGPICGTFRWHFRIHTGFERGSLHR